MKALLPIILLLSLVTPAKAEMNCGRLAKDYLEFRKPYGDLTRNTEAAGHFLGFVAGFRLGDNWRYFRVPQQVTHNQIAHVVGKWIQAHPEKWDRSWGHCLYEAFYDAWPKN